MATQQWDIGTSTSSDWSGFTHSHWKLNWSSLGAAVQSHNSAKRSCSVNFSASLVQGLATQVKFCDKPAQQVIGSLVIGLPLYFQTWVPSQRPLEVRWTLPTIFAPRVDLRNSSVILLPVILSDWAIIDGFYLRVCLCWNSNRASE